MNPEQGTLREMVKLPSEARLGAHRTGTKGRGVRMILGVIALGILAGLAAGITALFAGYSLLMALWFYTLFGCLVMTGGLLLTFTIQRLIQLKDRRHAYSN